jgi:mono/diheme cytochrome c family protein
MNPAISFVLCLALWPWQSASQPPREPVTPARAAASESDSIASGKSIFVGRCAKCHDDNANKKLPDGTTLLERLSKSKDPEARLGTRLKNEQERRQVFLYVQSLMAQRPADASHKSP